MSIVNHMNKDEIYNDLFNFMKPLIQEWWMNDNEYKEMFDYIFNNEKMNEVMENLDIGVKNGHSVEHQLQLTKQVLTILYGKCGK